MAVCLLSLLSCSYPKARSSEKPWYEIAVLAKASSSRIAVLAYSTRYARHEKDSPDPVPGTLIRLPAVRLPRTLASREQARHAAAGEGTRLGRAAPSGERRSVAPGLPAGQDRRSIARAIDEGWPDWPSYNELPFTGISRLS